MYHFSFNNPISMEIKELQDKVVNQFKHYCKENDIEIDKNFILAKLVEEVWELTQAILIDNQQCRKGKRVSKERSEYELKREIADVAGILFILAKEYDINIQKAIKDKWVDHIKAEDRPS